MTADYQQPNVETPKTNFSLRSNWVT